VHAEKGRGVNDRGYALPSEKIGEGRAEKGKESGWPANFGQQFRKDERVLDYFQVRKEGALRARSVQMRVDLELEGGKFKGGEEWWWCNGPRTREERMKRKWLKHKFYNHTKRGKGQKVDL